MLGYICWPVFCSLVLILLTPLINWYWNVFKNRKLSKIPGPEPIPILGNTNLLGNTPSGEFVYISVYNQSSIPNFADYLQGLLRLQRKYGNFYKLWTGPTLRLVVNKPEYLEDLLTSSINLSKSTGYDLFKPWLGDGLLISRG